MCQAVRDGGRRCPIHRHESIAAMQIVCEDTYLKKRQVENVFRELSREGRSASEPTDEQWENLLSGLRDEIPEDDDHEYENIHQNMDKAVEYSAKPDGKTFYALSNLRQRSNSQDENLSGLFEKVSKETSISVDVLRRKFDEDYRSAKTEYGEGDPEGYSATAYQRVKSQGYPYDKQSVVAIEKLRNSEALEKDSQPRVQRIKNHHEGSSIAEIGYAVDGGRLEVVLSSTPDHSYTYKNVPEEVWAELTNVVGTVRYDASSIYTNKVINNPDYQYNNAEESAKDSHAIRCTSCGQFASPVNHLCTANAPEEVSKIHKEPLEKEDWGNQKFDFDGSDPENPKVNGVTIVPDSEFIEPQVKDYVEGYTYQGNRIEDAEDASTIDERIDAYQGGGDTSRYVDASLKRREESEDMYVIPPVDESEKPLYVFTKLGDNEKREQSSWFRRQGDYYLSPVKEINSYQDYIKNFSDFDSDYAPSIVHTARVGRDVIEALNRGDVRIPLMMKIRQSSDLGGNSPRVREVQGTVDLRKGRDGSPYAHSSNLKCPCPEYAENYDCPHIRATEFFARNAPFAGQNEYEPAHREDESIIAERDSLWDREDVAIWSKMRDIRMFHDPNHIAYPDDETLLTEALARKKEFDRMIELQDREFEEHQQREEDSRVARFEAQEVQTKRALAGWKQSNPEMDRAHVDYREALLERWSSSESSYVDDPEKTNSAIRAAIARKRRGEPAVPFKEEGGVLDGASDYDGGRKFGVELEFNLPKNLTSNDNEDTLELAIAQDKLLSEIGEELYREGLTDSPDQQEYHYAAENGYEKWTFEDDQSVDGGELVSPILDDSPESWRQIKLVTEIIKKHGGHATSSTGSHVHVSTGTYEYSTTKRVELLRLNKDYEDTVYRLSTSPERGKHRGNMYCQPNTRDSAGDMSGDVQQGVGRLGFHHGHNSGVNIEGMGEELGKSNVEFRAWDGTLDPGTIQAQVMMSVAITDRAELNVLRKNGSLPRNSENELGSARENKRKTFDTTGKGGISDFLDTMFRKDEDKNQIASLFAVTKWQKK